MESPLAGSVERSRDDGGSGAGTGRGDRRRRAILDSADQLLREKGTARISLAEIARGAGLSRPAVYFYFDSKQAIVEAALARVVAEMAGPAAELAADEGMTLEAATGPIVRAVIATWRRHSPVLLAAEELVHQSVELRDKWRTAVDQVAPVVAFLVERDRARGLLPDLGDDAETSVRALSWMVERCCYMLFSREHTEQEEDELAETLTLLFKRALGVPS